VVKLRKVRTIERQVEEDGPEETIKAIEKTLEGPPYWMCSTIHFEYAAELRKAISSIKEGKLDELRELDKRLEHLRLQDLFD